MAMQDLCENMDAMLDVDDCNCSHFKEYEGFLDCLQKVHGGNPATKVGDFLKTMNDKNVSTTLLEGAMLLQLQQRYEWMNVFINIKVL